MTNAREDSQAFIVIGFTQADLPFRGGVMVPDPFYIGPSQPTGPTGEASFPITWPEDVPSGFTTYYQYWIVDPAGPKGLSASNAVSGTAP